MSSVIVAGNTSGSVSLTAPDVAGSTVITLPSTSGTMALAGSGVSSLNGETGAIINTDYGSIGSYIIAGYNGANLNTAVTVSRGTTVAGSTFVEAVGATSHPVSLGALSFDSNVVYSTTFGGSASLGLSGTWRILANLRGFSGAYGVVTYGSVLAVRIS